MGLQPILSIVMIVMGPNFWLMDHIIIRKGSTHQKFEYVFVSLREATSTIMSFNDDGGMVLPFGAFFMSALLNLGVFNNFFLSPQRKVSIFLFSLFVDCCCHLFLDGTK